MNRLKGITKLQKRQSRFKYQSRIYNVQRKSDVDHRSMKIIWNNKLFPSLNALNGKTFPYKRKVIIRHYHYWSSPKISPGIFVIRIIPCICHSCTDILSISWDPKIKEAVNPPRYGRVYSCKYSQIHGCHNNWILINFLDDGIDEEYYENINWTNIHGNVMNKSLIIIEVNMVHLIMMILYVLVIISSNFLHSHIHYKQTWVLMDKLFHQEKLYVKEMISFQSILVLIIMFHKKIFNITFYLKTIINGNENILFCYCDDFVPPCLKSIP